MNLLIHDSFPVTLCLSPAEQLTHLPFYFTLVCKLVWLPRHQLRLYLFATIIVVDLVLVP